MTARPGGRDASPGERASAPRSIYRLEGPEEMQALERLRTPADGTTRTPQPLPAQDQCMHAAHTLRARRVQVRYALLHAAYVATKYGWIYMDAATVLGYSTKYGCIYVICRQGD